MAMCISLVMGDLDLRDVRDELRFSKCLVMVNLSRFYLCNNIPKHKSAKIDIDLWEP
jgi:hypothetical protein